MPSKRVFCWWRDYGGDHGGERRSLAKGVAGPVSLSIGDQAGVKIGVRMAVFQRKEPGTVMKVIVGNESGPRVAIKFQVCLVSCAKAMSPYYAVS